MKKRFIEEQILDFFQQAEAGLPGKGMCRRRCFRGGSFYTLG
ncbi:IS3 family transposase, partial [Pseudomonas aeruginosa]|nr:IS3 family transposase [Pseudomonas aeruginosa]